MRHVEDRTREKVAVVTKRNGAWFVQLMGSATDDLTPDALFDCASAFAEAKRIAKASAVEVGYLGPWRWEQSSDWGNSWVLEGTYVDEYDRYYEDDEL